MTILAIDPGTLRMGYGVVVERPVMEAVDYGVIGLPVTFFIGANGIVEGRWVGAVTEDKLEDWTRALIDRSVPPDDSDGETPDGLFPLR